MPLFLEVLSFESEVFRDNLVDWEGAGDDEGMEVFECTEGINSEAGSTGQHPSEGKVASTIGVGLLLPVRMGTGKGLIAFLVEDAKMDIRPISLTAS